MVSKISREEYLEMYAVVGAALEVHKCLGRGLEEAIYQEALELELKELNIRHEAQKTLHMYYKNHVLNKVYMADLICFDGIMVELKAVDNVISEHRAQLMNYMRITKIKRGLLINFGEKSLRVERYIYQDDSDDFALLNESNLKKYITTGHND